MASLSDSSFGPGKYLLFDMSQDYPRGEHFEAKTAKSLDRFVSTFVTEWIDGRDPEEMNLILVGPYPGELNRVAEVQVRELWVAENEPLPRWSIRYPEDK